MSNRQYSSLTNNRTNNKSEHSVVAGDDILFYFFQHLVFHPFWMNEGISLKVDYIDLGHIYQKLSCRFSVIAQTSTLYYSRCVLVSD